MQVRASKDALRETCVDLEIRRNGKGTYHNSFFTSLRGTVGKGSGIACVGCVRRQIENHPFNCLRRHGYHLLWEP